jgi:Ketopantoate reductase PanE/ApbA
MKNQLDQYEKNIHTEQAPQPVGCPKTALRGSVDNGESHKENIRVMLASQEIIEAEVTSDTLSNYRSLEGLVVLCNKSYGNAALADALKDKIGYSPVVLLQNGLGVEQVFMDFPSVYRCVLFVTSQPVSDIFMFKNANLLYFSNSILCSWATILCNCVKNLDNRDKRAAKPISRINSIPRWK